MPISKLVNANLKQYTANGTNLAVLGRAEVSNKFGNKVVSHSVIVAQHLRNDGLLGEDFMVANKLAIDYGEMLLKFPDDFVVQFTGSKNKRTTTLVSGLDNFHQSNCCSPNNYSNDLLLITDGGFLASNKLFVPRIVTKVRNRRNPVTLQVTNLSDQSLFRKAGARITGLKPFREFSKETSTFCFQENKLNINRVEATIPDSL